MSRKQVVTTALSLLDDAISGEAQPDRAVRSGTLYFVIWSFTEIHFCTRFYHLEVLHLQRIIEVNDANATKIKQKIAQVMLIYG